MRALLDTHTFIWATGYQSKLSSRAREVIEDAKSSLLLSSVSVLEIAIKTSRGRLDLPEPLETLIPVGMSDLQLEPLPVLINHAQQVAQLPDHHRDPFDRLLVAQAQVEDVAILTSDPNIARYDVETIW